MSADDPPSVFRPGGLSYLHIPCREPARAADFYEAVFGWAPRRDGEEPAFADATGHVIGHFVSGEPAPEGVGILPFVYVDDIAATLRSVEAHGGRVEHQPRSEGSLLVATLCDPEGNLIGLWTETAV
jgi:uncharacterized protein